MGGAIRRKRPGSEGVPRGWVVGSLGQVRTERLRLGSRLARRASMVAVSADRVGAPTAIADSVRPGSVRVRR